MHAGSWVKVLHKDGIVVHSRETPGGDLPTFRGRTVMKASPAEILAVLQDVDRHCEWRPKCADASLVQQISPTQRRTYFRSPAPWPASDRDVVLHTKVEIVEPKTRIRTLFRASKHPSRPPLGGVIRISRLQGHYDLRADGAGNTRVEYQVDTDPGGSVPAWMVVRETQQTPFETLRNLRRQVRKTRGQYAAAVAKWNAAPASRAP